MMSNICVSGADSDKRNGIKRNRNRVGITKPEMAGMLKACPKLICALCQTPIKIWVSGGIECISCDRHIDPDGLYSTENIRFTHQKCNTVEGPWRTHGKSREIDDFRNMLTDVGVIWHEPDSIGGMEILSKNEEYFRSNKKQQIKLETRNMSNTSNETHITLDTVVFGGVRYELSRELALVWLNSRVAPQSPAATTPSKTLAALGNGKKAIEFRKKCAAWKLNPCKTPATNEDVCKWIEGHSPDDDITTDTLVEKFSGKMNPVTMKGVLCAILDSKQGKKILRRVSPGVYRRIKSTPKAEPATV